MAVGRGFKPGQSGNPGGRPRGLERLVRDRITEMRKEGDPRDGWERLVDHLFEIAIGDTSANDRDQIAAAKLLAERAYGHPKQTMDLHATGSALDKSDVSKLSDEELIEIAALDHTGQSAD